MNIFQKKLTWFVIVIAVLVLGAMYFGSLENAGFLSKLAVSGKWFVPVLLVAALVDSINPCAFSILLLTIGLLFSMGKMRRDIVKVGGVYIFGIFLVYVLIGLGVLQALTLFNVPHFMAKLGAILLIVFGLINLVNEFFPKFPVKLHIPQGAHRTMAKLMEKASVPTAFVLGVFVGLCEFPCTGGPYLLVLGLLHDQSTFLPGLGYLVVYNLIFVLPLVIVLGIASDKGFLGKVQEWKQKNPGRMRFAGGIAMVVLGIIIFLI